MSIMYGFCTESRIFMKIYLFPRGDLSIVVTCWRMAWYRHRCNVESTLFNVDVASCPAGYRVAPDRPGKLNSFLLVDLN